MHNKIFEIFKCLRIHSLVWILHIVVKYLKKIVEYSVEISSVVRDCEILEVFIIKIVRDQAIRH